MRTRQRKRIPDKYNLGKSATVPYLENESWNDRHYRRKMAALERKPEVEAWCRKHRWTLRITNNNHHWQFITAQKRRVEWFPSGGKLCIGGKWHNTLHLHDVDQLKEVLEDCVEAENESTQGRP